ncbi:hypothetical protein BRADI_3g22376v3 [Brachypodium distachyon]|uniref:Endonuclease/exonuclease/phosphatase domain-containing protein n=1 Tax=Brachypodium distachyon TaxID=15368 RepID=A0A2K2CYU4_BRADI|nr:hypothetical protein BRADI_3g22376v3 [Brachypodium distachyon]
MKIVSWNCRGLGNRTAVRGLLELQKSENPDMVFLSETGLIKSKLEKFRWMLGLPNLLARDWDETGGRGMALFWRSDVDVVLHDYSRYHIDVEVTESSGFVGLVIHSVNCN